MKIIIVGAGLGGLTAAFCFSRKSHEVLLLEQRPSFMALGTGLAIRPGASRVLHSWGLRSELEQVCDAATSFIIRDVESGDVTMQNIMTDVSDEVDWGTTRKDVMALLYRKACEAGAQVHFGVSVSSLHESGLEATLTSRNGRSFTADLILAADGIRSSLRRQVLADVKESIDPVVSDATLYGIDTIPLVRLHSRADAQRLLDTDFAYVWQGRDCFAVSRSRKSAGFFSGTFGIKADNDMKRLWEENGDIQYVRDFFKSAGACQDLLAALDEARSCDRWKMAELPNLPRWLSNGRRIALLGDSAHAMHPNAAMGYSLIVEELGVLEYLLDRTTEPARNIPQILTMWQDICKPRAERVKAYARENTKAFLGEPLPRRQRETHNQSQMKSFKACRISDRSNLNMIWELLGDLKLLIF